MTSESDFHGLAESLKAAARAQPGDQFWLGIAGPPGSGKSTLAQRLAALCESTCVIPMDGYHYYRHQLDSMPDSKEAHARRGAPFTFDAKRFVTDLENAKGNRRGYFPEFEHGRGDPVEDRIALTLKHRIVIVEGNYLLLPESPWNRIAANVLNESWFVDTPFSVCGERLNQRHQQVGRTREEAERRISDNDGPNAERIIRLCRHRADRLVVVAETEVQ